jgi:hypothetical protein
MDSYTRYDRPAHAEIGLNTRHFASTTPSGVAARTTTPPTNDMDVNGAATSVSFRFTMRTPFSTYMGGEAETGRFAGVEGSNIAGGYAVAGARAPIRLGSLSAELAGGWRSLRDSIDGPDHSFYILEPRVRGEMWLNPQLTLGAAAGAEVGGQHAWMAGIYIGVHSHAYARDPVR